MSSDKNNKSSHVHLKRIIAISKKEFLHIIHDSRSLIIIFILPVLQLVMFGYALNMEIQNIDLAVIDKNNTGLSRELVNTFRGSPYFSPFYYNGPMEKIDELFLNRQAQVLQGLG